MIIVSLLYTKNGLAVTLYMFSGPKYTNIVAAMTSIPFNIHPYGSPK